MWKKLGDKVLLCRERKLEFQIHYYKKCIFYVFSIVISMINMVELLVQNDIREFVCLFHTRDPR
jgi:hypothetical protein